MSTRIVTPLAPRTPTPRLYNPDGTKTGARIDGRSRATTVMGGGFQPLAPRHAGSDPLAGTEANARLANQSSLDQFHNMQIQSNEAKAAQQQERERQMREMRVSQAKANGTFPGIRNTFNNASTTQVMDENGRITNRPAATAAQGASASTGAASPSVASSGGGGGGAGDAGTGQTGGGFATGELLNGKLGSKVQDLAERAKKAAGKGGNSLFYEDGKARLKKKPRPGWGRMPGGTKGKWPGLPNRAPERGIPAPWRYEGKSPKPWRGKPMPFNPNDPKQQFEPRPALFTRRLSPDEFEDEMARLRKAGGDLQPLAKGGPMRKGRPYLVGEKGPELVVPKEDGVVIPNEVIEPGRKLKNAKGRDGKRKAKAGVKDKAAWFAREARRWRERA